VKTTYDGAATIEWPNGQTTEVLASLWRLNVDVEHPEPSDSFHKWGGRVTSLDGKALPVENAIFAAGAEVTTQLRIRGGSSGAVVLKPVSRRDQLTVDGYGDAPL
jgi:hypothetical protein